MMKRFLNAVWQFIILLMIFSFTRLLFFVFNIEAFRPLDSVEILKSFLYGVRFDYSILYYVNIIWLLLILIPYSQDKNGWLYPVLKTIFIFSSVILVILNISDIAYFNFTNSRSGMEMISALFSSPDIALNFPAFALTYWYLLLISIAFIYLIIRWYDYTPFKLNTIRLNIKWHTLTIIIILFHLISFGIARGTGLKPIRMITASEYVASRYAPLLLNTPFVIANTINEAEKPEYSYFSEGEAYNQIFNPYLKFETDSSFKQLNVFIIILESFGSEYIGALNNGTGYTPFLDSLISKSFVCTNGFSNAKRSDEALPAIISSLPALTDKSFVSSKYSVNETESLMKILKSKGYHTSFFHGGKNSTMGFDAFCRSAGVESYFGLNEYPDKKDFDGNWGIPDEEFLQFTLEKLTHFPEPFVSCVFTLSSHHPYDIPDKYAETFEEGKILIHKTIRYTDYALRRFFDEAAHTSWFDHTLFVLCADHTSHSVTEKYQTLRGIYDIPIIFFAPGDSSLKGTTKQVVKQADIMPSILDYLNYNGEVVSFGKSLFSASDQNICVNNRNGMFIYFDDSLCAVFDGTKITESYNYREDTLFLNGLTGENSGISEAELKTKAYIQDFFSRLYSNQLAE